MAEQHQMQGFALTKGFALTDSLLNLSGTSAESCSTLTGYWRLWQESFQPVMLNSGD